MAKFADHMEKIAEGVTEGYQKIEDGVVTGYKKIETGVVEGFGKIVDKCSGAMLNEDGTMKTGKVGEAVVGAYKRVEGAFVNTFMAKEGESVEDAKARMAADQQTRSEQMKADAEAREAAKRHRLKQAWKPAATQARKLDPYDKRKFFPLHLQCPGESRGAEYPEKVSSKRRNQNGRTDAAG